MRLRVCIIGNGSFAARTHYPVLASLDTVEIVGICAFDEERLRVTASAFGIQQQYIYQATSRVTYQQMLLQQQPDAVYAIGQPTEMFSIWLWCLKNGFNLFIEKPLGLNLHQARLLARLAQENKCITQVCHQRRSAPLMKKVLDLCLEKGPVRHTSIEFTKCDLEDMEGDRDRILDDFSHVVDTARWICSAEVTSIQAYCRRINSPDINCIQTNLFFDNGATAYLFGNWTSGRRVFRVNVQGTGICADIEPEKEAYVYADGDYTGTRYDTHDVAGSNALYIYGGFRQKTLEFIEAIRHKTKKIQTSSPFEDVVKTMEVCETILAQALLRGI